MFKERQGLMYNWLEIAYAISSNRASVFLNVYVYHTNVKQDYDRSLIDVVQRVDQYVTLTSWISCFVRQAVDVV
jgi:hypothetical protein